MDDKWFVKAPGMENKNICNQLFLFPYAGGGASVFRKWQTYFENTELFVVQYPGRENRMKEKPIEDFDLLIKKVFSELCKIISKDIPYFLFGHSLGTKVVYELTLKIQKHHLHPPEGLILSAGKAPCFEEKKPIHNLEENVFIEEIARFSGTPQEIIQNKEMMKIFVPMLRADFTLDETYRREKIEKVNCPILGLMGTQDQKLTLEEFLKWQEYTNLDFFYRFIEGGHMFVNTNSAIVIQDILEFIDEYNN